MYASNIEPVIPIAFFLIGPSLPTVSVEYLRDFTFFVEELILVSAHPFSNLTPEPRRVIARRWKHVDC